VPTPAFNPFKAAEDTVNDILGTKSVMVALEQTKRQRAASSSSSDSDSSGSSSTSSRTPSPKPTPRKQKKRSKTPELKEVKKEISPRKESRVSVKREQSNSPQKSKSKSKVDESSPKRTSRRSRSISSELRYSPAERHPERYHDIVQDKKRPSKVREAHSTKPAPVVRLRAQSDDGSDAETGVDGAALEEFQQSRREREEQQELRMLEQLKSGIAAKAKQKIKIMEKDPAKEGSEVSGSDQVTATKRNSLSEFLVANNVTALINTLTTTTVTLTTTPPPPLAVVVPLEQRQEQPQQRDPDRELSVPVEDPVKKRDTSTPPICKTPQVTANGDAKSPTLVHKNHVHHNRPPPQHMHHHSQQQQHHQHPPGKRIFHNRTLNNNPNSRHSTNNPHACGGGGVPHSNSNSSNSGGNSNNAAMLPFLAGTPGTYNRTTNRLNHGPLLTATHYNICKNHQHSLQQQQAHHLARGLVYNSALFGHGQRHPGLLSLTGAGVGMSGPGAPLLGHPSHVRGGGGPISFNAAAAAAAVAANSISYLHHHHQHQQKPKIVIKPFKIHDPQPLVAALADSSLVDAIVSKVSTATVAAAESAARRSRSRERRSRSKRRTSTSHHRHDSSSESRS